MDSRPSTFARVFVAGCLNVGTTLVLSSVIRALVAAAEMLFSMKSVATAAAPCYSPLYLVGRSNRHAATTARDRRVVVILKWFITVMATTKIVLNALS